MIFGHQPLVLDREIAAVLGLNEAIVLEQVHYWVEVNRKNKRNFHNGRYWTYNSMDAWGEEFPFWSHATVKRTFKRLRNANILITGNYNVFQMDKTLWYAIDYEELERRMKEAGYPKECTEQSDDVNRSKGIDDEEQDESVEEKELTPAIPENSTKTSTELLNPSISQAENREEEGQREGRGKSFERFQEKYNKIIDRCELHCIEESYREAVARAIKLLLLDVHRGKEMKISGTTIPAKVVEEDMGKIDFFVLQHAIDKFKEISAFSRIGNTIAYFKSCIYNAIGEMNIDMEARLRYAGVIGY